jgi:hypothetical protein
MDLKRRIWEISLSLFLSLSLSLSLYGNAMLVNPFHAEGDISWQLFSGDGMAKDTTIKEEKQ